MAAHPRGNRDLIRAINRSSVLNVTKSHGPISRTDIARLTGLSAATVSGITSALIEDDLIFEKEAGDSRGGRRPILLALNPRGGFVVGIKLQEDQAVGALIDLEATVIGNYSESIFRRSQTEAISTMGRVVDRLIQDSGINPQKLIGVGVGLAGIVDADTGILRHSPIFGWRNLPIGTLLREKFHAPVYVGNDVNTLTLTEKWFGAGQGLDNFLTVTIGRGVGMGIVVNGRIYRGFKGGAGEFGHTVIEPQGPVCACGNRGCLETFVSDPALMQAATEQIALGNLPETIESVEDLLAEAKAGNPNALSIYAKAGQVLGLGMANLISVFSPQLIIISGEGVRAGDLIFGPMRETLSQHVMAGQADETEIKVDVWNDTAWARGAAGLVLQDLFESPVHRDVERI